MFQFFKKKIENTKTISDYKKQYLREKTTESIEALFKELKQSKVWVPFNASLMDGSDEQEGVRLTGYSTKGRRLLLSLFLDGTGYS